MKLNSQSEPKDIVVHPGFGIDQGEDFYSFGERATDDFHSAIRSGSMITTLVTDGPSLECEYLFVFEKSLFRNELIEIVNKFESKDVIFAAYSKDQAVVIKSLSRNQTTRVLCEPFRCRYNNIFFASDFPKTGRKKFWKAGFNPKRTSFIISPRDAKTILTSPGLSGLLRKTGVIVSGDPDFESELPSFIGKDRVVISDEFYETLQSAMDSEQVVLFSNWIKDRNVH
jgi:hypothetical protein